MFVGYADVVLVVEVVIGVGVVSRNVVMTGKDVNFESDDDSVDGDGIGFNIFVVVVVVLVVIVVIVAYWQDPFRQFPFVEFERMQALPQPPQFLESLLTL